MHQVIRGFLLIYFIVFINWNTQECPEYTQDYTKVFNFIKTEKKKTFSVHGTIYHPLIAQTDSSPLETASLKIIDTTKLRKGHLKWVAVSRDLHKKWGGCFRYGDTILVTCKKEPRLNGRWLIHDVMNPKWKLKIDFLQHHESKLIGHFKNIQIEHRPRSRSHKYLKISSEFSRLTGYKKNG